jgi:hypothetical protein
MPSSRSSSKRHGDDPLEARPPRRPEGRPVPAGRPVYLAHRHPGRRGGRARRAAPGGDVRHRRHQAVRGRVRRLAGRHLRPRPLLRHGRPPRRHVRLRGRRRRRDHLPQHHLLGLLPPRLWPGRYRRLRGNRPGHALPRSRRRRAPHHAPHQGDRRRPLPRPSGGDGRHRGRRPAPRGQGDRGRLPRPRGGSTGGGKSAPWGTSVPPR